MTQHPDNALAMPDTLPADRFFVGPEAADKAYVEHLPIEELRPVLAALLRHLELQLYKSDGFYSDVEYSFKPIGTQTP